MHQKSHTFFAPLSAALRMRSAWRRSCPGDGMCRPFSISLLCGLALLVVAPSAFAQWGDASDIPTYLNGDYGRRYQRDISILIGLDEEDNPGGIDEVEIDLNLQLLVTDNYTLQYQGTINTATANGPDGIAGERDPDTIPNNGDEYNDDLPADFRATNVYRRVRTQGAMTIVEGPIRSLTGANLPIIGTFTGNLDVTVNGNSALGYFLAGHPAAGTPFDWTAVGDLAMVRDAFGIPLNTPATINVQNPSVGSVNFTNEQVGFGLSLDHGTAGGGGGYEWADFPMLDDVVDTGGTGEEWSQNVRRQLSGNLRLYLDFEVTVAFISAFSDTLDEQFPIDPAGAGFNIAMTDRLQDLTIMDPISGHFNTRHVNGIAGAAVDRDQIYYSPTEKSITSWTMGAPRILINEFDPGGVTSTARVVTLENFTTRYTGLGEAISVIGIGDLANAASGDLANVPLPAGIADNDILLLIMTSDDNAVCAVDQGFAAWGQLQGLTSTNRGEIWWKRVSGAQTAPTITRSGTTNAILARITAFRGCSTSLNPPFEPDAAPLNANASSTTITANDVTVNGANRMMVWTAHVFDDAHANIPAPTNYVQRFFNDTNSGNDATLSLATRYNPPTGASGNVTSTMTGEDPNIGGLLALIPQNAAEPTGPFSGITIMPTMPTYGQNFMVRGTMSGSPEDVILTIDLPGGGGSTVTVSSATLAGVGAILMAPSMGDFTPMNFGAGSPDVGSFGISFRRNSSTLHEKVVTLRLAQLGHPPTLTPSPTRTPTPSPTPSPSPMSTLSPTPSPTASPTPVDDASSTENTIPSLAGGEHDFAFTITLQNTGTSTWSTSGVYVLTKTVDTCGMFAGSQIALPGGLDVLPGGSAAFAGTFTAPTAPDTCDLQFQMTHNGTPFGAIVGGVIDVQTADNNADVLSNTVPPAMAPNQGLWVGLTARNTGNTQWPTDGSYLLSVTDDPCDLIPPPGVAAMDYVNPTKQHQFMIYLTAPATTGPCALELQMEEIAPGPIRADAGPGLFGEIFSTTIQIEEPPNATEDWSVYE